MTTKTKATVLLKIDHIISDRTQYKPYIAQLSADALYVEIEIQPEEIRATKDQVILTVDGLAAIMGNVATAIEKMNRESMKKSHGY